MRTWCKAVLGVLLGVSLAAPAWAVSIPSVASGEAESREAALTSALRHAVEQVVGMSVDSSTYVANLKSIQDRIYTSAGGYIESYKVVDEARLPGGGYRLTVSALISKEKLSAAVNPLVGGGVVELDGRLALQNVKLEQDSQKALERKFKTLLDEMAAPATTKITYGLKTTASTEKQDEVVLTFENLRVVFDPGWYRRLRTFIVSLQGNKASKAIYENYIHYANYYTHGGGQLFVDLVDEAGDVINSTRIYDGLWCNPFYSTDGPQHLGRHFENWIKPPVLPPEPVCARETLLVKVKATQLAATRKVVVRVGLFNEGKWPVPLD